MRNRLALAVIALVVACGKSSRDADSARAADVVTAPDGNAIVYETHGDGSQALIFVHCWACDRGFWSEQVDAFSRQYKVVTIDLGGHGESGMGRETWTIPAFGADVAAVVEELRLERVILIGHSMGGDVILEAARRLPGRVAGLVWVDAHKQLGTPRTDAEVQGFVDHLRADFVTNTRALVRSLFTSTADSALVERVVKDISAAPRRVAIPSARAALSYDREVPAALQQLKLPVVAINPDNMPTDTASLARYGVEVVIMPGVGHFLMMEDPGRFNRILRGVVEKLALR